MLEERGEVAVDLVEGGEQPVAALAVQRADALAEDAEELLEDMTKKATAQREIVAEK